MPPDRASAPSERHESREVRRDPRDGTVWELVAEDGSVCTVESVDRPLDCRHVTRGYWICWDRVVGQDQKGEPGDG